MENGILFSDIKEAVGAVLKYHFPFIEESVNREILNRNEIEIAPFNEREILEKENSRILEKLQE